MKRLTKLCITTIATLALGFGCDKGLAPPPGKPFIAGRVQFRGAWPPQDSVKNLVLVLVPGDPPFRIDSLIAGVTNKSILPFVLNYHSADTAFRFDAYPGHFGYLGVAERYGDSLFKDWRSVGFAHDGRDSALKFDVVPGYQIGDVVVDVNFDSLPWQPFVQ